MITLTNKTIIVHQLIALCSPNTVLNIILHSLEKQLIDNCCSCSSSVVNFQSHSCLFLPTLIVNIMFIQESLFIVISS